MKITLSIGADDVEAELYDHPVAREFSTMLPLALVFTDFNHVEKVAPLGHQLTLHGVPDADTPQPGEIGYYAPSGNLVLYYKSPGTWPGLVRLGRLAYDLDTLRALPDKTRIRLGWPGSGNQEREPVSSV